MTRLFFLIFLAVSVKSDPHILPLSKFSSSLSSSINGVEGGAKLYLASSDDNSVLKNIIITTGATSVTLDKLNDFNDDGTPKSLLIAGDLRVDTSNNDTIMATMTGNLYVTSKAQADDPNFSVYVIKDQHTISTNAMKSTVVILNTWLGDVSADLDKPLRTSYVTGINQSPNTNLYFQWGIPPTDWYEYTNNTFFRNPVNLINGTSPLNITYTKVFFDNVEPLQIGLDYWYFMVMGPINMQISKKYVSNDNYNTTAVDTTGLIVNEYLYQDHVVNFMPDLTRTGVSGVFFSHSALSGTFGVYLMSEKGSVSYFGNFPYPNTWSFYTDEQATQLIVNSTSHRPGTFYCQYFSFAGDVFPTTTPLTTEVPTTTTPTTIAVTTTTVGTSTRGAGFVNKLEFIILMILGIWFS
ncbi:unnamed protein product [Caenorhabditis nigoni]